MHVLHVLSIICRCSGKQLRQLSLTKRIHLIFWTKSWGNWRWDTSCTCTVYLHNLLAIQCCSHLGCMHSHVSQYCSQSTLSLIELEHWCANCICVHVCYIPYSWPHPYVHVLCVYQEKGYRRESNLANLLCTIASTHDCISHVHTWWFN